MRLERRSVQFDDVTVDETSRSFAGYGSVFGVRDSYGDVVVKGAFTDSLKTRTPVMLLQHGGGMLGGSGQDMTPIGVWDEVREDDHGLRMKGHLLDADTDVLRHTYSALKAGALNGLSIGFKTIESEEAKDGEDDTRRLTAVDLWEVSLVTFPANADSLVTDVKSDEDLPTEREFERWLRDAGGLSRRQSRIVISAGYKALKRDAGDELVRMIAAGTAILRGE